MKLGIIGLPGAGKNTLFETLTQTHNGPERKSENKTGTVHVPDFRIDRLSTLYKPKKTTYAQVHYFLPGTVMGDDQKAKEQRWSDVRDSDAFIHIIRNFPLAGDAAPDPLADFNKMEQEMILSDLIVAENRLERLEFDRRKGREYHAEEYHIIEKIRAILENGEPVRSHSELNAHSFLRGFAFLSSMPMLILFNNADTDERVPDIPAITHRFDCLAVRGKLEHEISRLKGDAEVFLKEYGIIETARDSVIRKSYEILGLISYSTVGEDEVRAWTIRKETTAMEAAGAIHSDIRKGFIRAETVSYEDLLTAGSYPEARRKGTVRLEGRDYLVQDGDIINFRFHV